MRLKDEIRKIVQLQESDLRIRKLRQKKDIEIPDQVEKRKVEFEQMRQRISNFEEVLKNAQLKKKEKELDLAAKEENARKSQTQLYQLKTNKEYQAKLKEISFLKADISVLEEEVLTILVLVIPDPFFQK